MITNTAQAHKFYDGNCRCRCQSDSHPANSVTTFGHFCLSCARFVSLYQRPHSRASHCCTRTHLAGLWQVSLQALLIAHNAVCLTQWHSILHPHTTSTMCLLAFKEWHPCSICNITANSAALSQE